MGEDETVKPQAPDDNAGDGEGKIGRNLGLEFAEVATRQAQAAKGVVVDEKKKWHEGPSL